MRDNGVLLALPPPPPPGPAPLPVWFCTMCVIIDSLGVSRDPMEFAHFLEEGIKRDDGICSLIGVRGGRQSNAEFLKNLSCVCDYRWNPNWRKPDFGHHYMY